MLVNFPITHLFQSIIRKKGKDLFFFMFYLDFVYTSIFNTFYEADFYFCCVLFCFLLLLFCFALFVYFACFGFFCWFFVVVFVDFFFRLLFCLSFYYLFYYLFSSDSCDWSWPRLLLFRYIFLYNNMHIVFYLLNVTVHEPFL